MTLLFNLQGGEVDDTMICQDVAMLGPLMLKQHSKLKVGTCTRTLRYPNG